MKLKNLIIAASVTASIALTGCTQTTGEGSGTDPNGSNTKVYVDIVTLESTGSNGTSLTIQRIDDAPSVTYYSIQDLDGALNKGDRLVISYTPTSGDRYQSGPILIYEAMKTFGAGVPPYPKTAAQTLDWKSDPIELYELHRSGDYVNVIFNAEANYSDVAAELVLDSETAESDMPEYHIIFTRKSQDTSAQKYAFYMSYSIEDQWKRDDLRGIRIKYVDSKIGETHKDLLKVSPVTPKPAN